MACRFANLRGAFYPQDRVLRYPDGHVRTIRYPSPASPEYSEPEPSAGDADSAGSAAPAWRICGENDTSCVLLGSYDTDSTLPGAAPVGDLWADEAHERGGATVETSESPTNRRAIPRNEGKSSDTHHALDVDGDMADSRASSVGASCFS